MIKCLEPLCLVLYIAMSVVFSSVRSSPYII